MDGSSYLNSGYFPFPHKPSPPTPGKHRVGFFTLYIPSCLMRRLSSPCLRRHTDHRGYILLQRRGLHRVLHHQWALRQKNTLLGQQVREVAADKWREDIDPLMKLKV